MHESSTAPSLWKYLIGDSRLGWCSVPPREHSPVPLAALAANASSPVSCSAIVRGTLLLLWLVTMIMSKMKTLAFGALLYAVTFASLHGTPGAQAETVNCDDAPGMEGCSSESTSSSSTAKPDKDTGPAILKLHKTLTFDEPTVSGVCTFTSCHAAFRTYTQPPHVHTASVLPPGLIQNRKFQPLLSCMVHGRA